MLSSRPAVLAPADDLVSDRWARLVGGVRVVDARALAIPRPVLVHVRLRVCELGRAAAWSTLAGARSVVVTPVGSPERLPWWHRRFHRFVLPTQDDARAWAAAGIALGRLVVVEPGTDEVEGEALRCVYAESLSMR